jgi:hypothetical protein
MISLQMKMFISTFVLHVIITIAVNAVFHLNDNLILDHKRKNRDKNDDRHDHDEFNENEAIDARI